MKKNPLFNHLLHQLRDESFSTYELIIKLIHMKKINNTHFMIDLTPCVL